MNVKIKPTSTLVMSMNRDILIELNPACCLHVTAGPYRAPLNINERNMCMKKYDDPSSNFSVFRVGTRSHFQLGESYPHCQRKIAF